MQSPSSSRSSVLGKRMHRRDESMSCDQLLTPDPTPKRPRTSSTELDGDHNKENVPPFNFESLNIASSPRATRALRRANTSAVITPPRPAARPRSSSFSPQLTTPPPTPPSVPQPLHVRVRALLRPTSNDYSDMPGRDSERKKITDFITRFLDAEEPSDCSALYISGSPGTGKTALVNSIIQNINLDEHNARVIVVNCMALNSVDALWERLVEDLESIKKRKAVKGKKAKASNTIESVLAALTSKCILILDELDHIAPTSQALAALLAIPSSNPSVLRVIGIANTHTLASFTSNATCDVQTLHFAPYTPNQLLQILEARLSPLYTGKDANEAKSFMATPALTLLSKKVAALSGDVRSLLEVLRGAIDLAIVSPTPQNAAPVLTPAHILAALKAQTSSTKDSRPAPARSNSETVTKIRSLGLQARLGLLSLLLAASRLEAGLTLSSSPVKRTASTSNGDGIETGQLYAYYSAVLLRVESGVFSSVSRSEFEDLVNVLEGVGLVSLSSTAELSSPVKGKRSFKRSASFGCGANKGCTSARIQLAAGVWVDEVLRGLGASAPSPSDLQEEEIRSIWEREKARLARDVKNADSNTGSKVAGFEDAMEI